MAGTEAMRLYVRTLEEEKPDWWTPEVAEAFEAQEHEASANGTETAAAETTKPTGGSTSTPVALPPLHPSPSTVNSVPVKSRSVAEVVVEGSWVSPYIASDRRPPPRYEQAMALVGNHLYIIGGNCGGRYLADTWALNLENLTWRCVSAGKSPALKSSVAEAAEKGGDVEERIALVAPVFSPVAGHAAVQWNGNVVSIGGHTKVKDASELPVHLLDTQTGTWSRLSPTVAGEDAGGAPPHPRGSHSATVIGNKAYVFGGEGLKRKLIDELWTLDLSTMEWDKPLTTGPIPSARSAHTACSFRNRYIVIFGGGSVATCFDDLAVLDTQTMEWSKPDTEGPTPPPRAGHAAAVLGSTLYIVGGGNNARGCADMYALDISNLGAGGPLRWTLVGNTPAESAIAAEGLSLLCIPMAGCMVSFGGYNGRYHNAVHVYRPEGFVVVKPSGGAPTPVAARGAGSSTGGPQSGLARREPSDASLSGSQNAAASHAELEAARREAAAAKEAVALEISIMRRQLDSATSALADAERAAEDAREALESEQQRAMALEVEVAELRQKLVAMEDMEKELARYRQRAVEDASKKPGLWGFITGADQAAAEKEAS